MLSFRYVLPDTSNYTKLQKLNVVNNIIKLLGLRIKEYLQEKSNLDQTTYTLKYNSNKTKSIIYLQYISASDTIEFDLAFVDTNNNVIAYERIYTNFKGSFNKLVYESGLNVFYGYEIQYISVSPTKKIEIDLGYEIESEGNQKSNFNEIVNSEVLFQNSVKQKLLKKIKISPSGNIQVLRSGFITGGVLSVTGFKNILDEQIFRKATNDIANVFNEAVDITGKYKLSINSTNKATLGSKTVAELGKIRISKGLITGTGALLPELGFAALAGVAVGYLVLNPDVYQNAVKNFYKHSLQLGIELGIQAKTLGDAIKEAVATGQEKIVITESEVDIDEHNAEVQKYWEKQWLDYYGQAYDPNNPSPPKIEERIDYQKLQAETLIEQSKQQALYYEAAKKVIDFDNTIKGYESLKIANGEKAVIDDLTKRELQKRVEFVETSTGIYAGGQRVEGVIDGEGNIVAGGQRTGVKITPEGIYMAGETGGSTVSGSVDLNVPTDTKVQIDADAFVQALANNKVKFDTSGLETALSSPAGKVSFNYDPFAQFITDNKLKIDNTGLQEILDSKSIQVQGGVAVNWGTAPKLAIQDGSTVGLDETSLTGITTIAEKIVARDAREAELHADKKAVLENQKTLTDNDVTMKDTKNKIAEKEEVITGLKAKAMGQTINGYAYDERVAHEYTNLHSQASFQTAEGVTIKEGLYSNPSLSNQRVYNDTMLSESKIRGKEKFANEFMPALKAIIPESKEGTLILGISILLLKIGYP